MKIISIRQLPLTLLFCALASPVMASTPLDVASAAEINVANELVQEGKYDEALESYRQIQPTSEIKEELNYNIAVAEYRKGETEAAKTLFTEVSASPQSPLAAAARYNLGNCFYADAVTQAEQDPPAAIEALQQAIQHYRGSLAVDANQVDARANIELAMEFLKKLKQKQDQKQNQEQNQENKDQQEQNDQENKDQQKSDSQQNQQSEQNQDSQSQDQKQDQQKQDSQSQDSESMKNDSQQDQESKGNPDESKSDPQSQEESEQKEEKPPEESQKNPGEQNEQSKPEQSPEQSMNQQPKSSRDQASPEEQSPGEQSEEEPSSKDDQPIPSGELKAANEQDQSQQPNGQVGVNDPNAKEAPMSKEEALKMLQAVRDRDFLRRLRQEQKERRQHIPTDRDW